MCRRCRKKHRSQLLHAEASSSSNEKHLKKIEID